VAGTVAGLSYGAAKGASVVGIRVLSCSGSGSTSGIIASLDWIETNFVSPAVVTMSLGGSFSASLNAAVDSLVDAGVVVVRSSPPRVLPSSSPSTWHSNSQYDSGRRQCEKRGEMPASLARARVIPGGGCR
jgi:hypothetical protein